MVPAIPEGDKVKKPQRRTPSRLNQSIGGRLEVSSDEIMKFLALKREGTVTIREDLTIRYGK